MSADMRAKYLSQRVMTATPGQRVVMLYDRLHLDLQRAADIPDPAESGEHISHALQIIAELAGSLEINAGGPAENLSSIYGFLLAELSAVRAGATEKLAGCLRIVITLRDAWAKAVNSAPAAAATASGAWVG